jgi:hypothetical protein
LHQILSKAVPPNRSLIETGEEGVMRYNTSVNPSTTPITEREGRCGKARDTDKIENALCEYTVL